MERNLHREQKLSSYLSDCPLFSEAFYFDETDSTNNRCRELFTEGKKEGTLVVAKHQTAGHGRLGRRFHSPAGTGLYMSLILEPTLASADFGLITAGAAVAVREAIFRLTGISADIKWVNDLYHNGKKLCGILAEGRFEQDRSAVILGIGVNLKKPEGDYAEDIKDIAVSLDEIAPENDVDALKLCSEIVRSFNDIYQTMEERGFIKTYRDASCVLHKTIRFLHNGTEKVAKAIDIDDDARLVVRLENGEILSLSSGEVQLVRTIE